MRFGDRLRLRRLKRRARKLYLKASAGSSWSCGVKLADYIQGNPRELAKQEFESVWVQIRALDPDAPQSPFAQKVAPGFRA